MAISVAPPLTLLVNSLVVPANTAKASPASKSWTIPPGVATKIVVTIPRGHNGFTGFGLDYGAMRLVPFSQQTDWLIGDDRIFEHPLDVQVTSALTLRGFNTGNLQHTFYVELSVNLAALTAGVQPVGVSPL